MALTVLDASVVIGFVDARDAHHAAAVRAVTGSRADVLVLPATAYAEILVGPMRRGASALRNADGFVSDLGLRIEPVTEAIARHAARLHARHGGLRLPDALVLATGDVLDAASVLTADRTWAKLSRRARVI